MNGVLEYISDQKRAEIIQQLPYWQARLSTRRREYNAHAMTVNVTRMPAGLVAKYRALNAQMIAAEKVSREAEALFREGVEKAIAQGKLDPSKLPNGLGLLPLVVVAIVIVVVASLGYLGSINLMNMTRALQAQTEAWERAWTAYLAEYRVWADAERAAGRTPPPPAPPTSVPGSGDAGIVATTAAAGISVATLAVAGGLLWLFMKGNR